MKLIMTLLIITLITSIPTTSYAEDAITSKEESVRLLVATSRRFIAETYIPQQGKTHAIEHVMSKRNRIVRTLDCSIAGGQVPAFKKLRKIRRWLDRYYVIGSQSGIYKIGTKEDAAFALNTQMAVTYMDCALHLAFSLRQ